jgi:hypothetical protein
MIVTDRITPLSKSEAIEALWDGWMAYYGSAPPSEGCIEIVSAQWGIETGWGKSCHCYNFGNARPGTGWTGDVVCFRCNELVKPSVAASYHNADPEHCTVADPHRPDGQVWLWFLPPHVGSQFRAFPDAAAGAADHISLLARRFPASIQAARSGSPTLYAHALKASGYYTADEASYSRGISGCVKAFQGLPINWDQLPALSDADREQLEGWLAAGLAIGVQDALDGAAEARKDANTEK